MAHFGSENESLKGFIEIHVTMFGNQFLFSIHCENCVKSCRVYDWFCLSSIKIKCEVVRTPRVEGHS